VPQHEGSLKASWEIFSNSICDLLYSRVDDSSVAEAVQNVSTDG